MIRLQVNDFSCIKNADFTVGKYNVIIGPQASGKSVISKLLYFFIDSVSDAHDMIYEQKSPDDFPEMIRNKFSDWFPKSAWGNNRFGIQFEIGCFNIKISRTGRNDSLNSNPRITISKRLKSHLAEIEELYQKMVQELQSSKKNYMRDIGFKWEFKSLAGKCLNKSLGEDYVQFQTFIPAGRSFFTNLGRAFMAFDQGRILDPLTLQFGRLYASLQQEFRAGVSIHPNVGNEIIFSHLLGGKIVWDGESPTLHTQDGRIVPFSALSSGQQELLPLVVALRLVASQKSWRTLPPSIFYIEEPEAHLFPAAQADVIEGLVAMIGQENQTRRLVLTTHSPYVLTKLNNLAKAGLLERDLPEKQAGKLDRIVKKKHRIEPGFLKAYALKNGILSNLVEEDGLIDGEYLDEISNRLGSEFSKLIDLELDAHDTGGMRTRDE